MIISVVCINGSHWCSEDGKCVPIKVDQPISKHLRNTSNFAFKRNINFFHSLGNIVEKSYNLNLFFPVTTIFIRNI